MRSYIVLGLGRFGKSLAATLSSMGHEVLAVDQDSAVVQNFAKHVTHTVQANITDDDFLKSMGIEKFDAAIVGVGSNMQISIMATVLLKQLGAKYILVKAQDDFEEKILYTVGADKVILPESNMGVKTAHNLATDNFYETIEISSEYRIISVPAPENWCGKTIGELSVRSKYGINIVAIKGNNNIIIPVADTLIEKEMVLTIMGSNADLRKINNKR
jgi:trk system potassium uptake protein TrkA